MKRLFFSGMLAISGLAVALPTCAEISEATFTPQGSNTCDSVPSREVEVFVYKPDFKFKVIGVIEARGMYTGASLGDLFDIDKWLDTTPIGEKEDIALAMKALKKEATRAGAHGVIILQSRQVRVSERATARRITAAAICRVP